MQLRTWSRLRAVGRLLSVGAACCLVLAALRGPAFGQGEAPPSLNDPVIVVTSNKSTMQVVERFSKIAKLPARILRVDGFDPAVINVTAMSPTEFRIQAIAPGVTTIVFADENGGLYTLETFVVGDVRHLQAYIDRLFPGSSVKAVPVKDSVVLRGWVTRPDEITAIVEIAEQFSPRVLNQMQVGGAQQVIMKVKVMEVQRSKIRSLGFNFLFQDNNQFATNTVGQVASLNGVPAIGGQSGGNVVASQSLAAAQLAAGIVHNTRLFQGFLEALKNENLLKILAEPTLTTSNGRPAQMLAGGEFPILVPNNLNVTIKFKQFGVQLEAVPTILGNGRVRLELAPEISEKDFSSSVTVSGISVPGLKTRRVNTQVEMQFGQTYMLAGLLSLRQVAATSKVPFFGELPFVGTIFRRVKYDDSETELVILVTPELAGPMTPDQVPCGGPGSSSDVPTDTEFYCNGMIEVPFYGSHCDMNCDLGGLPGTRLHYVTPCQNGNCQPIPATMPYEMEGSGSGPTMGSGPLPAPAPAAQPGSSKAIPQAPLPGPAAKPEIPAPTAEGSAGKPTANNQWYQYNPSSEARGTTKAASDRPGLIAPGG